MPDLTFKEVVQKTIAVVEAFQKVEQREWGIESSMIELTKQVGELAKNVMMLENYYLARKKTDPNFNKASKDEIGNELSDILYMIIRIAHHYRIDLETAHMKELDSALMYIKEK